MTNGPMHFFKKVSLKGELLCVRITIMLSNVCVSDSGRETLPEGAGSMHLPPSGAVPGSLVGLEFTVKTNSKVIRGPGCNGSSGSSRMF